MKILILGCGNIGALYDFENESILTHAKAFSIHNNSKMFFYDIDSKLAKTVAEKYQSNFISNQNDIKFDEFDCISICTPTNTHFDLLVKAINANVKLIICEKPISNSKNELENLNRIYKDSNSRILVNYIRRFQPEYIKLKNYIHDLLTKEELTNISIRYQRGFINNCSHAFDVISFLTSLKVKLAEIKKQNIVYDHFEYDPTISIMASWNTANLNVLGLSNVQFSHFEIDLFFKTVKVAILESGNVINISESKVGGRVLNPLKFNEQLSHVNCLKDYMLNVVNRVYEMYDNESIEDNFLDSLDLNLAMLNI